ncbi:MAG: hypothetical protein AB8B65_16340 [Kordia sp.]|uniref:hypothetical protein n=1 Tax=Kordia sp. TaxID=1965332 RepID=UPI00385E666C
MYRFAEFLAAVNTSLESENVKGGATNSCFINVDTGCAKSIGCNYTNTCPTALTCVTACLQTCQPTCNVGGTQVTCIMSISCPVNGIC